jgi:hypothetical protein
MYDADESIMVDDDDDNCNDSKSENSQADDDQHIYHCDNCNEATIFSSAKLLPDDSYKELCLTDTCITAAVKTLAEELAEI